MKNEFNSSLPQRDGKGKRKKEQQTFFSPNLNNFLSRNFENKNHQTSPIKNLKFCLLLHILEY